MIRAQGHDALAVTEAGFSGKPDDAVRYFAIKSGGVLITLDADLGDILRFPTAGTPGVIRPKLHPPTEEAIRDLVLRTLLASSRPAPVGASTDVST
jgi:predicted nuclease of predicted toxin-antitoxin system